ncbi:transposase [Streptomyces sp. NPDC006553]|uniref:transposase n=1 Tax=unclassified Streptomyces TaxID=2593676 RepID=UPI00338FA4D7
MGGDLSQQLVPDDLWEMVEPVLPPFRSRAQGGGTAPWDQRAVVTAVVHVLTSGRGGISRRRSECRRRRLTVGSSSGPPPECGVSCAT